MVCSCALNVIWIINRTNRGVPMRAGEVYVNPASGERAVVVLGTDETAGKRLVVDLHLRPNGGMIGRHYHPKIREQFRVLTGSLAYTLNGNERIANVGESVDIPPGTLHDFWNPGKEAALVRVDVQPAERFVALIKNGFSLAQDGKTDRTGKPGILQIAMLAREFDHVIRYDKGPRVIQQAEVPSGKTASLPALRQGVYLCNAVARCCRSRRAIRYGPDEG
jgi:quercetin dioxygenase-like cupin family protein